MIKCSLIDYFERIHGYTIWKMRSISINLNCRHCSISINLASQDQALLIYCYRFLDLCLNTDNTCLSPALCGTSEPTFTVEQIWLLIHTEWMVLGSSVSWLIFGFSLRLVVACFRCLIQSACTLAQPAPRRRLGMIQTAMFHSDGLGLCTFWCSVPSDSQ